jgi:hypothetical protein
MTTQEEIDQFFRDLFDDAENRIFPQMMGSMYVLGVMAKPDIYLALQVGLALVLDKPLILLIPPETWVSPRLRSLADIVVDGDIGDPAVKEKMRAAVQKIMRKDAPQ